MSKKIAFDIEVENCEISVILFYVLKNVCSRYIFYTMNQNGEFLQVTEGFVKYAMDMIGNL